MRKPVADKFGKPYTLSFGTDTLNLTAVKEIAEQCC